MEDKRLRGVEWCMGAWDMGRGVEVEVDGGGWRGKMGGYPCNPK